MMLEILKLEDKMRWCFSPYRIFLNHRTLNEELTARDLSNVIM